MAEIGQQGFQLRGVTGPQAVMAWPDAVPLFNKHKQVWEAYETLDQIRNTIVRGYAQLWLLYEGDEAILLLVTKTEEMASGLRTFMATYLIGKGFFTEPRVAKLALEYVETYGIMGGCTVMKAVTLARIAHHLEIYGFETTRHVVEKTLTGQGALN